MPQGARTMPQLIAHAEELHRQAGEVLAAARTLRTLQNCLAPAGID